MSRHNLSFEMLPQREQLLVVMNEQLMQQNVMLLKELNETKKTMLNIPKLVGKELEKEKKHFTALVNEARTYVSKLPK